MRRAWRTVVRRTGTRPRCSEGSRRPIVTVSGTVRLARHARPSMLALGRALGVQCDFGVGGDEGGGSAGPRVRSTTRRGRLKGGRSFNLRLRTKDGAREL